MSNTVWTTSDDRKAEQLGWTIVGGDTARSWTLWRIENKQLSTRDLPTLWEDVKRKSAEDPLYQKAYMLLVKCQLFTGRVPYE